MSGVTTFEDLFSDREMKWDLRHLEEARQQSTYSKDRSTQVGSVVTRDNRILTTGYNGFPPGLNDDIDARHERPAKYLWTEHAERNAIFQAAGTSISLKGATLYSTCAPCAPCARAILSAGIVRVVWPEGAINPRFADDYEVAMEMFNERGIRTCAVQVS